jgi:hypothetical protein
MLDEEQDVFADLSGDARTCHAALSLERFTVRNQP